MVEINESTLMLVMFFSTQSGYGISFIMGKKECLLKISLTDVLLLKLLFFQCVYFQSKNPEQNTQPIKEMLTLFILLWVHKYRISS